MPEIVSAPGWGDSWGENWGGQNVISVEEPYQYWIEIITASGDRVFIDQLTALSVTRRHTAISDWSAVVGYRSSLSNRLLLAVRIFWGDSILFHGRIEELSGDINDPTIELVGRGVEADLTRGQISPPVFDLERHEAIELIWNEYTPFEATVDAPAAADHPGRMNISATPSVTGSSSEYSGTPMRVLKKLHNEGDMRFTVHHSTPGFTVSSYPSDARSRRPDWNIIDGDRDMSAMDYANVVTVTGGPRENGDGRYYGTARDENEIAELNARDVGNDGEILYPIDDPSIVSDEDMSKPAAMTGDQKCAAKARAELPKFVNKDAVGGSLEITPVVAQPGYQHYISTFEQLSPKTFGEGVFGEGVFGQNTGRYATLDSIEYSIEFGSNDKCSVELNQRSGFVETLESEYRQEEI